MCCKIWTEELSELGNCMKSTNNFNKELNLNKEDTET